MGGRSEETFTRHLRAIEDERISLQEEMGILLVDHIDFDAVIQKARQIMGDLRTSWNTLGPNERKVFLRFLVPDGIGFENGSVRTPLSIDGIRGALNRTGIVGGSRLWKQGWSHGKEQPTKKPAGEALLT